MSKKRLEEIKKLRETILEENDYRTRCVLASVFVSLGYMDYLIKQAERVQELEKEKERYQSGRNVAVKTKMKMDDLEKQNKRYREALKNIYDLAEYDEYDNVLEQIVSEVEKALEGDDD